MNENAPTFPQYPLLLSKLQMRIPKYTMKQITNGEKKKTTTHIKSTQRFSLFYIILFAYSADIYGILLASRKTIIYSRTYHVYSIKFFMRASSMSPFFLFSFIFIILTSSHSISSQSLKSQASILVSLKHHFEVPNSLFRTWDLKNYLSLCSWTGIKCDNENKTIIELDISNQNISGSFSPVITKLHTLQVLNISNNQFNGSLNWNFSEMRNLIVLDIYDNSFSGVLPVDITKLMKLKYLDFGGNFFSGKIPSTYGNFKQLEYLSLAGNDLVGFIPSQLSNLTSLQNLRLGYYNQFEGGVPNEFGNLINLIHLDLSSCGLQGSIPSKLGKLSKLDTLYLQTNQLTDSIPPQIANLTSLKILDLSNNALTGEIPGEFSSITNLTLLNLFINKFHGEIPNSIADLPNLEVLKLWQNNFTGSIPSNLGRNGKIVELDLSTNKLTGLVPKWLCFGKKLKTLILLNNFLFGSLPEELGGCESLVKVRMGQNYLTGSIPKGFLYLPEVALIELQNNYLSGDFEEEGEKMPTKLAQLNLSNNRLSKSIPSSIGNFSSLKELSLSGNQFSSEIPSELSKLKNILNLDLSRNNFSGEIPSEIGYCSSLTYLDLSENQLSGPLPAEISEINNLNYLNISFNFLNQSLPREIGSMKSLTSADFSHNNFSGKVPENGQFSLFNSTSYSGNPFLCDFSSNPCNTSFSSPLQNNKESTKSKVPAKYKLILAFGLLFCSLIFAVLAVIRTRKTRKNADSWKLLQFQKLDFNSENILNCVKDENEVGRGGAGIVYRGTMPNGELVAVKKLLGINKGSSHDNGLSAEIQTLGKIRHRNIVRLLAFCSNKDTNLLVYEYMSNGSLGEVLHGKRGGYLNWNIRLQIAIEAAKGLCYLHHDCSPLVIHRDIKSNNILLNPDFEAHVADFGLAKFLQDNGTSECMSAIAGSYGYIAPEYAYTLKVDEKSDVYSYGVVLLELITGRRPVGGFGEDGMDIVQWAKVQTNWAKEGVANILDERLKKVPLNEAMQVFFVAMLCVEEHSVERPTMREVVQMLAQAKQPNTFHLQ